MKRAREKDKKKKLTNMICYLFEKAAKEQHTMIILDDAQWIDKDSWIMLHEIIKRCRVSVIIINTVNNLVTLAPLLLLWQHYCNHGNHSGAYSL